MTRFNPLLLYVLVFTAASLHAQTAGSGITGPGLPGMERFDSAVISLMTRFNSPGAQLAVTRNGRLVLARGYGLADRDSGEPVQPDSLFRIASMSKFITALAALTLVEQGRLDLELKAFPFLGLTPLPSATNLDSRIQDITVRHLLHHTGGWDRDISGDQTFNTTAIAAAAGVPAPADVDTVIRYHLGRRLDFDPGTRYAYANIGYVTLGRIIEKITGQSLANYARSNILARAGVTRAIQGRSLLEHRQPGEVRYYDYPGAPLVRSVFSPTTALVPNPYGGFVMENRSASGAWVFTAIDYVRLLGAIDGSRPGAGILAPASIDLLTERPASPVSVGSVTHYAMGLNVNTGNGTGLRANWFHDGGLPGTATYMVRFASGWSYAILFNTRPLNLNENAEISAAMNAAFSAVTPPTTGDLFLTARPEIISNSRPQTAVVGGSATFSVSVSSVTPPTYQWFKDGTPIPGATLSVLIVPTLTAADAGAYHTVVANVAGAVTSAAATLTLEAPSTASRLVNLSILTPLAAGETMTLGTVVGGPGTSGTKPLLVRAVGPSLSPLGVSGALTDPKLDIFSGQSVVASNDNWGGTSALSTAFTNVGAFSLASPDSRDAAIFSPTLTSGGYTIDVAGVGGSSGSVIAELYDSTPASTFTATTPRLVNVSVLKFIRAGETLTAGFVIGGLTTKQVLIRAVGPTLAVAPFALVDTIPDPKLELFNGPALIDANDNWGGAAVAAASSAVGAFALGPGSRDAALLVALPPGSYTAQVAGVADAAGLTLIELYEVQPE